MISRTPHQVGCTARDKPLIIVVVQQRSGVDAVDVGGLLTVDCGKED